MAAALSDPCWHPIILSNSGPLHTHTGPLAGWSSQRGTDREEKQTLFPLFLAVLGFGNILTPMGNGLLLEYMIMARNEWFEKEEKFLAIFKKKKTQSCR